MPEDEKVNDKSVSDDEKDQNCDCGFFVIVGTVCSSVVFSQWYSTRYR